MQGDPTTDFISQGPVMGLFAMTCFFGILWIGMIYLVSRRHAERQRRRREGLPPLPNVFEQFINLIQSKSTAANPPQTSTPSPAYSGFTAPPRPPAIPASTMTSLPVPDLDLLTADFHSSDGEAEATYLHPQEKPEILPAIEGVTEHEEVMMKHTPHTEHPEQIPTDAVEVMRMWRDVSDGSLIVEMNGIIFQTVSEMKDQGLEKRFINLVRDLSQMAKAGAQLAGLKVPMFDSASQVLPQPGEWSAVNQPAPEPVQPPPKTARPEDLSPSLTADPLNSIRANAPTETTEDKGIAGQIEEFLQFRLMQTPTFKHRNIHIRPAYDGSIRIQVGERYYEAIGDIVEADVREFIQSVIREWEARQ
jgi:hypothetical protein